MADGNAVITMSGKGSVEAVGAALEKAFTARSFGVIAVHDLHGIMAKKGVPLERACRVYEVCNPGQAKKVLDARMDISTALPCRISVYEEDGETRLTTIDPNILLGMFGAAELSEVAREVAEVMIASMHEAAEAA